MIPSLEHFGTHDESEFPHLWDGVVGAWCPSLGPTGLRLHDFSRRANWGTLTNMDPATDWVVDGGQYALDFDGTDDFCDLGEFPSLTKATISCWCKLRSATPLSGSKTSPPFAQDSISAASHYTWVDSLIYFETLRAAGSRVTIAPSASVNRAAWHLLTILNDGLRYQVFQNNILIHDSASTPIGSARLCIGRVQRGTDQAYWFDGLVSDAVLWDRGLSPTEIDRLYEIGRGGIYTPRRRRRAYSFGPTGLRRRLLMTGQT